jgi:hypothetical protein
MQTPIDHRTYETEGSLFLEYRWLLPLRGTWERTRDLLGLKVRGRTNYQDHR